MTVCPPLQLVPAFLHKSTDVTLFKWLNLFYEIMCHEIIENMSFYKYTLEVINEVVYIIA